MSETLAKAAKGYPERPRIKIERGVVDMVIDVIAIGAIAATIGLIAFHWSRLPERIPHHFDLAGKPDAWGGRWLLVILPVISILLCISLTAVSRIPHRFNYLWAITPENAESQYRIALSMLAILKVIIAIMFAYMTWITIRVSQESAPGLGLLFMPVFGGGILINIVVHLLAAYRAR